MMTAACWPPLPGWYSCQLTLKCLQMFKCKAATPHKLSRPYPKIYIHFYKPAAAPNQTQAVAESCLCLPAYQCTGIVPPGTSRPRRFAAGNSPHGTGR